MKSSCIHSTLDLSVVKPKILKKSIWTACITPFDEKENIHFEDFEILLRNQNEWENGILLMGSTGENTSLTPEERKSILDFATRLNLSVPLVSGVPNYSLKMALEWVKVCNHYPLDGVLISSPCYTRPGPQGQISWFKHLLDASVHGVFLYNVPARTGVPLFPKVLEALVHHPKLLGLKHSGNMVDFMAYRQIAPHLPIYCDDDEDMPPMMIMGSQGLFSVAANIWPEAIRLYLRHRLSLPPDSLMPWWKALKALSVTTNPVPIKSLMCEMGMIRYDVVRPPLSALDLNPQDRLALRQHHAVIYDWVCTWRHRLQEQSIWSHKQEVPPHAPSQEAFYTDSDSD